MTTAATATAMSAPGSDRLIRGATIMIAITKATIPRDGRTAPTSVAPIVATATQAVFVPGAGGTPRASGICWTKMITAMPRVKPSTTGHGM